MSAAESIVLDATPDVAAAAAGVAAATSPNSAHGERTERLLKLACKAFKKRKTEALPDEEIIRFLRHTANKLNTLEIPKEQMMGCLVAMAKHLPEAVAQIKKEGPDSFWNLAAKREQWLKCFRLDGFTRERYNELAAGNASVLIYPPEKIEPLVSEFTHYFEPDGILRSRCFQAIMSRAWHMAAHVGAATLLRHFEDLPGWRKNIIE